jgi:hypothetical protein
MAAAVAASVAALVSCAAPRRAPRANLRTAWLLLGRRFRRRWCCSCCFRAFRARSGAAAGCLFRHHGLSDSMAPGNLSQLTLSDAIAFRVDFKGEPPRRRALYWRGPVMWDFDGRTWRLGNPRIVDLVPPTTERASRIPCCSSRTTGTGSSRSSFRQACRRRRATSTTASSSS